MNHCLSKSVLLIIFAFLVVSLAYPTHVIAISATQSSDPGCHTLFMLDNQNKFAQLYATNFDSPNTVQLLQSKDLHTIHPLQQRLFQLRSGQFGLIYYDRAEGYSVVRYTTFDPTSPISIVYQAPVDIRTHFPDVVELSDGTLIAVFSYSKDTVLARVSGSKSKCFDGFKRTKAHCTQDVRAAILKSTDQGLTWSRITSLDNDDIKVDRRGAFFQTRIAVGPNDALYLLVVEQYYDPNPDNQKRDTETLWKSTNRGVRWTRVSNVFTAPYPFYQSNEGDLVIKPDGRIVVVFNTNYHPGMSPGDQGDYLLITSSSDDGATWTAPKIVGKFGPNKGPGSMPSLQIINGNRYGINFHKFSDPVSTYSYVFSQNNSLSNWSSAYPIDPPDSGNPDINPVCVKNNTSSTPTPTPTTIPGDLTDEGDKPGDEVNIYDYNLLVSDFGKTGSPGWIPADIIQNGKVDIFDYNVLVGNFGR